MKTIAIIALILVASQTIADKAFDAFLEKDKNSFQRQSGRKDDKQEEKITVPTKAAPAKVIPAKKEAGNPKLPGQAIQASHILITIPPKASDEVVTQKQKVIEEIRQSLIKGADFAAIARKSSNCPSGKKGGDLGVFGRGQMVKEFEKAAFTQRVGEIGPIIRTAFGFHILRVTARGDALSPLPAPAAKTTETQKPKLSGQVIQAGHILITVPAKASNEVVAQKQKIIEEIRQSLIKGADFAAIARKSSNCPSGKKGGDLGVFGRGQMAKEFEKAAFSQRVGEIGPIIKTTFGFHIIRVTARGDALPPLPTLKAKTCCPGH